MKKLSKLQISIIYLIITVMLATATVYALFSSAKNYDFELNTLTAPERTLSVSNLNTGDQFGAVSFSQPNESKTFNFSLTNNDYDVASYKILLSVTTIRSLSDNIKVYLDGAEKGVLSALVDKNGNVVLPVNGSIVSGNSVNHSIALTYVGAQTLTQDNTATVSLTAKGYSASVILSATVNGAKLDGKTLSFASPDDLYSMNVQVDNITTATALNYLLNLTVSDDTSNIAYSIVVSLDGVVKGTLGELSKGGVASLYIDKPLYAGESQTHIVTLKYLNGAKFYTGKTFTLSLNAEGRTDVKQGDYLIASSADQLTQLIRQANITNKFNNKTILLVGGGEFTLDKDLTVTKPLNIDLNGKTLNLNGHTLTYAMQGIANLYSNRAGGTVTGGTVILNSANGLVYSDYPITINASNYSMSLLLNESYNFIKNKVSQGVTGNVSLGTDYKTKFGNYSDKLSLALDGSATAIAVNNGLTTITLTAEDYTKLYTLSVSVADTTKTMPIRVFGNTSKSFIDTVVDAYIAADLGYINVYTTATEVNYNLPLPTFAGRVQLQNAIGQDYLSSDMTIEWISSKPGIMSTTGEYHAPESDTTVEMAGLFHYNGQTAVRYFSFTATSISPQDKLDKYLLGKVMKFTTVGAYYALPLGNESIVLNSFLNPTEYPSMFAFKTENGVNYVSLVNGSDVTRTYITVNATVDGVNISGKIVAKIDLTGSVSIFDLAQQYNENEISLVEMPLCLANIKLPAYYITDAKDKVAITYSLLDSFSVVGVTEPYVNPTGYATYAAVGALDTNSTATDYADDFYTIDFTRNAFPNEDTKLYIRAAYTFNNVTVYFPLEITLSGVIHYDSTGVKGVANIDLYTEILRQLDTNADGYLTLAESQTVPTEGLTLTVKNKGITTIKGLELFTQFSTIDLSNNKISDLTPLKNNYSVTKLILSNNKIQTADVCGTLIRLTELDLSNNLVTDISALSNLGKLQVLKLNGTGGYMSDFSVLENFSDIRNLYLYQRINTVSLATYYNQLITAYTGAKTTPNFFVYSNYNSGKWTPTTEQIQANVIINYLAPIYRVTGYLYLPQTVKFNGTDLTVGWSTTSALIDTDGTNIVNSNGVVAINRPSVDFPITLTASLTYGETKINRDFKFVVVSNGAKQYVYNNGTYVLAETVIPDNMLRYILFKTFNMADDTTAVTVDGVAIDKANVLTPTEIAQSKEVSANNAGINDLTGIQLFGNITLLSLENNPLAATYSLGNVIGLSPLNTMSNLVTLKLSGYEYDFSKLTLATLQKLYVVGCKNIDGEKAENDLFILALNNTSSLKIYKQSTTTEWNPYASILYKEASKLQDVIILPARTTLNNPIILPSFIILTINETDYKIDVGYGSWGTGKQYYHDVVGQWTSEGHIYDKLYSNSVVPSEDTAENVGVTLTLNGQSVSVMQTIYCLADTTTSLGNTYGYIRVEMPDGSTVKLNDVVKDTSVRGTIIKADSDSNGLVTRTEINAITSLTFDGLSNTDLLGLEIFKGSNLATLTLNKYNKSSGFNYATLTTANYPSLTTISFNGSNVNFNDFTGLSALTTINASKCRNLVFDEYNASGVIVGGIFANYFPNVTTLSVVDNKISSFYFLKDMKATTIEAYTNPASTDIMNDLYLSDAYDNMIAANPGATQSYRIVDSSTYWVPSLPIVPDTIADLGVVFTPTSGSAMNMVKGTNRVNVIGVGTLNLPQSISGAAITWTVSANKILVAGTNGNYTVVPSNKDAFVYVTGTFDTTTKSYDYLFVVKADSTVTSGDTFVSGTAMPLTDFSANGNFTYGASNQLQDAYFTYSVFNALKTANATNEVGVYTSTEVANLKKLTITNNALSSIKGIKNLTALNNLDLNHNSVSDISELYYLSNMQTLDLSFNCIDNLWYDSNGNGVTDNGDVSIFNNMTKLTSLYIQSNGNITEFMAIMYSVRANDYHKPEDSDSSGTISDAEKLAAGYRVYASGYSLKNLTCFPYSARSYDYINKTATTFAPLDYLGDTDYSYLLLRWIQFYDNPSDVSAEYASYDTMKLVMSLKTANSTVSGATNMWHLRNILIALYDNSNFSPTYEYTFDTLKPYLAGLKNVSMGINDTVTLGASTLTYNSMTYDVKYYAIGSYNLNQDRSGLSDGSPNLKLADGSITKDNSTINILVGVVHRSSFVYRVMKVKINVTGDLSGNSYINLNETECGYYGVSTVGLTANETVNGTAYYSIETSLVIPDSYLRAMLVYSFAGNDKTITYGERNTSKSELDLAGRHIENICGFEFFPNVTSWKFNYNPIKSLPGLRSNGVGIPAQMIEAMNFNQMYFYNCYSLVDISNLTIYSAKLKYLTFTDCGSIKQDQWQYLTQLPNLVSLRLHDATTTRNSMYTRISDFTFALSLPKTNMVLRFKYAVSDDIAKNNYDIGKAILFSTKNSPGNVSLSFMNASTYIWDYLDLSSSYSPGATFVCTDGTTPNIKLPATIQLYGVNYSLRYYFSDKNTTLRADGDRLTTLTTDATLSLRISVYLGSVENYYDTVTLTQSGSAAQSAPDQTIWFVKTDNTYVDLATMLLDKGLREAVYYDYYYRSGNSDNANTVYGSKRIIKQSLLETKTDMELPGTLSRNYNFIGNWNGLGEFLKTYAPNLRNLYLHDSLNSDITPLLGLKDIASLTQLQITTFKGIIENTDILKNFTQITTLKTDGSPYYNLNGLVGMNNLVTFTSASGQRGIIFSHVGSTKYAIAYTQLKWGNLAEVEYLNLSDAEKQCALILGDELTFDSVWGTVDASTYRLGVSLSGGSSLVIPQNGTYAGIDYTVSVQAMSPNAIVSLDGSSISFTTDSSRPYAKFLLRVEYNGCACERMFEVAVG